MGGLKLFENVLRVISALAAAAISITRAVGNIGRLRESGA